MWLGLNIAYKIYDVKLNQAGLSPQNCKSILIELLFLDLEQSLVARYITDNDTQQIIYVPW